MWSPIDRLSHTLSTCPVIYEPSTTKHRTAEVMSSGTPPARSRAQCCVQNLLEKGCGQGVAIYLGAMQLAVIPSSLTSSASDRAAPINPPSGAVHAREPKIPSHDIVPNFIDTKAVSSSQANTLRAALLFETA